MEWESNPEKLYKKRLFTTAFFQLLLFTFFVPSCAYQSTMKTEKDWNTLTKEEEHVIVNKGTEYPFTGEYNNWKESGYFVCRRCESPLYRTTDKFDSGCGWPSFDDEIAGSVTRVPDADGRRVEIICTNCKGHLGHVFEGEGFTSKDTRHCVNSLSILFKKEI